MLCYRYASQSSASPSEKNKVVFVDRDGVINVDLIGDYIKTPQEFRFEKGAVEALKILSDSGYQIVIVSNQAGVGDGIFSEEALKQIHNHMIELLTAQGIRVHSAFYCLHGKQAGCKCRKPEIGMFLEAAKGLTFDKSKTFFIGDKSTDIEAGKRFGLKTAFVRTGHGKADELKLTPEIAPDIRSNHFLEAVQQMVKL